MYRVNKKDNTIEPVPKKTFTELNYKEVTNLQEWIAKKPSCLGEDLLIIQKEFQGFDDTKERLDLLAIDKEGSLVIIENKLDDSGKDVIWQALKYAAYCSTLTKLQIIDIYSKYLRKDISVATEKLAEFLEKESLEGVNLNEANSQRVFLVAAKFRKEITSTVLWLSEYNLPLKCFRVTPHSQNNEDYVIFDQVIPLKDAEDYRIRMAEKTQEKLIEKQKESSRNLILFDFWTRLLEELSSKSDLFSNISPQKSNWIMRGAGKQGISYIFSIVKNEATVSLDLNFQASGTSSEEKKEINKRRFDQIFKYKSEIEAQSGLTLNWLRGEDTQASWIQYKVQEGYSSENLKEVREKLIDAMIRLEKVMSKYVKKLD